MQEWQDKVMGVEIFASIFLFPCPDCQIIVFATGPIGLCFAGDKGGKSGENNR